MFQIAEKSRRELNGAQLQLVELLVVAGRPSMVHIPERVSEVMTHEDVHDRQG